MDGQAEGDELDPLDIFDTSLQILFSIPPIAFSSNPGDGLYVYHRPTIPEERNQDTDASSSASNQPLITKSRDSMPCSPSAIRLRIPDPDAGVFSKLQANYIWLSAMYLADLTSLGAIVPGRRVAELGAGAGLPGIVAARIGCEVLSTDWGDEDILRCLKENFERNCSLPGEDRGEVARWAVMAHEWGTDPSPLLAFDGGGQFDTLFLADTLWISSAQGALLDSIRALLALSGTAYIAAGLHTGRRPIESFILAAEGRGARVRKMKEVRWTQDGHWEESSGEGRNGAEGLEERGVVVHLELTWRG